MNAPAVPGRLVVTLIGKVNAGKSLLCNRLLKQELAAVAPVAGWTKEISLYQLAGDVFLADTPGLEDVEEAVAAKTFDFIGDSDLFLHVVNADEGLTRSVRAAHSAMVATSRPVVLVCNKSDHLDAEDRRVVARQLAEGLVCESLVVTSAAFGDGVGDLAAELWRILDRRGDALRFARLMRVRVPQMLARASVKADEAIHWATGRAAAIAVFPLPLADVAPLIANEVYMVKGIGEAYGLELSDGVARGLLAAAGASFVGLALASFLPGLKVAIAPAITYGAGQAVKAWCASDGALSDGELRAIFARERAAGARRRR